MFKAAVNYTFYRKSEGLVEKWVNCCPDANSGFREGTDSDSKISSHRYLSSQENAFALDPLGNM